VFDAIPTLFLLLGLTAELAQSNIAALTGTVVDKSGHREVSLAVNFNF
jgi:hypothetical protein